MQDVDGILTEPFTKERSVEMTPKLHEFINSIRSNEILPENWHKSVIYHIYEKSGKFCCENYRGIFELLLYTCYKVLSKIMERTLKSFTKGVVGKYQGGF